MLEFRLVPARIDRSLNRLVAELTIDGRPTAMLVPVMLLDGNLQRCDQEAPVS